jgi:hypothetical protein
MKPAANEDRPQQAIVVYQPHNALCVNCGLVFSEEYRYITGHGQVLCPLCAAEDRKRLPPDSPY